MGTKRLGKRAKKGEQPNPSSRRKRTRQLRALADSDLNERDLRIVTLWDAVVAAGGKPNNALIARQVGCSRQHVWTIVKETSRVWQPGSGFRTESRSPLGGLDKA